VTDDTRPNPYLDDPLRDVAPDGGLELTKINPAYMTRQMAGIVKDESGVAFNLTSLRPLRPGNRPDPWEAAALKEFEEGTKERVELLDLDGEKVYRYMAPLYVKEACLECHAEQGYRAGDVRGGLSIAMPAGIFLSAQKSQRDSEVVFHLVLFLSGLGIFLLFYQRCCRAVRFIGESEKRFEDVADNTGDWVWETDAQGRYTYSSPVVEKVLGYKAEEVLGRHFHEFLHPEDGGETKNAVADIISRRESFRDLLNRKVRKDGKAVIVSTSGVPVFSDKGELRGYRGVVTDVTDQTEAEESRKLYTVKLEELAVDLTKAEGQIKASLREKEVLLQEIHHRVKNNMQVISSILGLQAGYVGDEDARGVLRECQGRIRSMAAIHEKLYRSEDFARIAFGDYVRDLCRELFRVYRVEENRVSLALDVEDMTLSLYYAIPCGLIINELVSNSLKYAFPGGREGEVRVSVRSEGDEMELVVADNGVGLPEAVEWESPGTLGLHMVNILGKEQLRADMDLDSKGGARFTFRFEVDRERGS
jgi:PAS domain S-box-containing protein